MLADASRSTAATPPRLASSKGQHTFLLAARAAWRLACNAFCRAVARAALTRCSHDKYDGIGMESGGITTLRNASSPRHRFAPRQQQHGSPA